jgi:class 3 adenylate cyclase/tetratricopeptide (TPR) repeat protein
MNACITCGSPLPEDARFCPSCGSPTTLPNAGQERKVVTVLFADVTGSTALGERLDPERFREVMQSYGSAMREEIEAEGGTVEKFIGDAVMAAFGVPAAHEDDPERALRAALRMMRRLDELNGDLERGYDVSLQIRVGVNTGEVLAATSPGPGEAMVTGDAVNAAARLQGVADPGTIFVSQRTADAVRGFSFEDRGLHELKGKRDRVRALRLVEETGLGSRGVPGLSAPMVGRASELDLLRSIHERVVRERRPHLVTVYGDAGVGKSRLTAEFLLSAESTDPATTVLRGRCLPYGDGITYWPLAEILKGHAGILDSDPPELAVEKVRKTGRDLLTQEVATDPTRSTAALAYTVGLEDPEVSFAHADPREVRDELHAAWRSFFTALGRSAPIIVVIEDIHWADPVLLDLLDELAEHVEGSVLFLCPARPELTAKRPSWGGGRRNMSSIALDPLSSEEAERLVRLLLTVDDLPTSIHRKILERAEGNPFYLEEIVRRLIDGGLLLREGDRWRATSGIEDVEIPDTVQAVLASRIDLLEPDDKRSLQAASVVGRVFWSGPVIELTGVSAVEADGSLRRLEDRELVLSRPGSTLAGQREYIFKHVLTRDVAYESLPRRDRIDAHTNVAGWLERTAGERVVEFAELLAYHYLTAAGLAQETRGAAPDGTRSSAMRWLLRASHDSLRRLGIRKAQRFAEQAIELAASDAERVDALEAMAEACFDAYEGDLAWRYFREAAEVLSRAAPDEGERIAYLAARACEVPQRWPGSIRGTPPAEEEATEVYELGRAALPPGDSEARIRLLGVRAGWLFGYPLPEQATMEDLRPYESAGIEAAEVALRMGLPDLASGALDAANAAWVSLGYYNRMFPLWERRAELLPVLTDPLEIGDCYSAGAWCLFELGRYPEGLGIADDGLVQIAGRGPNVELHVRSWRVAILHRLARWDEALAEHELIRDLLDERRDDPPYFVSQAIAVVGMIHESRGDRVESDRMTGTLTRIAPGNSRVQAFLQRLLAMRGDLSTARSFEPTVHWRVHANDLYEADAELLAAAGTWDEAPRMIDEMREHETRTGTAALVPFADRLEGRAASAAGDDARAEASLRGAIERFDRLGAGWERALTEVDLARVLASVGRGDEARATIAPAIAMFEGLRSVKDLAVARQVLDRA